MTASKSLSCSWVTQPLPRSSFGFGPVSVGRPCPGRGRKRWLPRAHLLSWSGGSEGTADTTGMRGGAPAAWGPQEATPSLSPVMPTSGVRDCSSVFSPTSSTWVCLGSSQPACSSLGAPDCSYSPRLLLSRGFLWWLVAGRLDCLWGRKPLPHPPCLWPFWSGVLQIVSEGS